MNAVTEDAVTGKKRGRKSKARIEDGQEKVIELSVVKERRDELVNLYNRAKEAGEDFATAIKKAAEDSGLPAKPLRSFIVATAGEKFMARKRENEQLELLFTEVGLV